MSPIERSRDDNLRNDSLEESAQIDVLVDGHTEGNTAEVEQARVLAARYRLQYVDMEHFHIDQDLFRSIPAEFMLRYGFVPHRKDGDTLEIVVSDPTDLPMID